MAVLCAKTTTTSSGLENDKEITEDDSASPISSKATIKHVRL